jgi:hypothetical protein
MTRTTARPNQIQEKSRQKYFKGRVIAEDRAFPFVVWDGIRRYQSHPPPNLLVAENLTGHTCIAQVRQHAVGTETITVLLQDSDSVILWARDTAVYRSIVANIMRRSDGWLS